MKVTLTIDTTAAVRGDEPSQARALEVEAATYEDGREQLRGMVPDGWQAVAFAVPDRADTYQPPRRIR